MRLIITILVVLPITMSSLVYGSDRDHEWARQAVASGKAMPLARIIESIENMHDATVYEVYLMESDDVNVTSIYRIKLVSEDGKLIELLVDTLSGSPIGIGGQGISDETHDAGEQGER